MGFIEEIEYCIPGSPSDEIRWDQIEQLLARSCFAGMKDTCQNPVYHREGNVYIHTQMVCRELLRHPLFRELPVRQKTELFLAAILHDIGKVKTTRLEDGKWVSPNHTSAGSRITRAFLWEECGLCGTKEMITFRETVCTLIRYHMLPVYLVNQKNPERKIREVAAVGELAEDFSWQLLCALAEADTKGKIADDPEEGLTRIGLARMLAEETGCLDGPYAFADNYTKHAYLSGRNVQPEQILYDDTWGEVIMLSGLPGTGKDTWICRNFPGMPMVSLDGIRKEFRIGPEDEQGEVIRKAQERAREYLRKKESFVWNATDLTKETRQKLTGLFERYKARVRIVYLETDLKTRKVRNAERPEEVPDDVAARMLAKTVLPTPDEAQTVEWLCI